MSRGGRGGGRGGKRDGGLTFSLESMGLTRGEALPPPTLTPPPNYPSIADCRPLPLHDNEIDNYLLTLKQEFRQSMITSKYFISATKEKSQIERYSDKYENIATDSVSDNDIQIDWRIFPTELCPKKSKTKKKIKVENNKDLNQKLEKLIEDEKEDKSDDQNSDEEVNNNASDVEKEEVPEEDVEEETDYMFSYFDNGENYLEESDDNGDEGPTY
ncbi:DNA-directed RNA polymerase III subunit RPC7-like [Oppia nitens]|uniref:DNA-directed RNA polymerase III subunit RPC7-like n=1 Tax=Oppia nitens TaxID=1686743 RepID=UPI0023DB6FED|nr:DNA-directed RNA polymerase III subunit RPC7-like [Oppia nitens]